MKCGFLKGFYVLSFSLLSVALFASSSASAASPYDDTYKTTDDLILRAEFSNTTCETNYNTNWAELVTTDNQGVTQQMVESFQTAIQNGRWGVSLIDGGWQTNIAIYWTEDSSMELTWGAYGSGTALSSINVNYMLQFGYINTDCDVYNMGPSSGGSGVVSTSNSDFLNYLVYVDEDKINYPTGYEGEPIRDTITIIGSTDWTPNIKLHHGSNWSVEFSDRNFLTFDDKPFLCGEEGFAPLIEWKIYDINDSSPELIDTLLFSASAVNTFNAPKVGTNMKYKLEARYTGCDGISFEHFSEDEFTIRADGSLNPPDFQTVCLIEDFPYINIEGCMAMLNETLAALSFNIFGNNKIDDGWSLTENCRQLQVLDDWIFAPNQTICPQVPSTVRNVVTPFVTMAVGLMLITFVSRRGDSNV